MKKSALGKKQGNVFIFETIQFSLFSAKAIRK